MKVIIKENYEELSKEAAEIIKEAIQKKPNLVLGLATGSTPLGCYQELIRLYQKEGLDFSKVIIFNLDEYLGLSADHPQSYNYFMQENLLNHINVKQENFHIPLGIIKNIEKFCQEYEEEIKKAGGIDLQLLGIGSDGHIGFNEPGTPLNSRTHLAKLAESTIKDNSRFFEREEDVPRFAITMGVQTIFEAKKIVLLASGENKADAVAKALEGPITPQITASILQKHPDTIVILDQAAASKLKGKY
ncbi:MAG: glucosamine-6-phosphate deaminase [Patescibacteria group bacterium]|nr:glucosamine-6-phosphate deaminase [Patescibacteria group bacterium]